MKSWEEHWEMSAWDSLGMSFGCYFFNFSFCFRCANIWAPSKPKNVAAGSASRLLLLWALQVKARDLQASCGFLFNSGQGIHGRRMRSGRCSIDQTVCWSWGWMEYECYRKRTKGRLGQPSLAAGAGCLLETAPVVMELLQPRPGVWHCDFLMAKQPCPVLALGGK